MTTVLANPCAECGAELAAGVLACHACGRLVHAAELDALARTAAEAEAKSDVTAELAAWRRALELLPHGTKQKTRIQEKILALSARVDALPAEAAKKSPVPKWLASLGFVGLLLWKFKFLVVLALTKGKFILLGLTKWKTVLSMALSLGAYWTLWGWPFALGFVLAIYVHEMGHVAALRRYGIRASAPMFIPGFGAFVRLEQHLATAVEDARVGIAGPWWGLGASLVAYGLYLATDQAIYAAIAHTSAWINLFNLIPVWQLDGARAFASLATKQRWWCVLALCAAFFVTHEYLFVLLIAAAIYKAWKTAAPVEPDQRGLVYYVAVMAGHSALMLVHVPGVTKHNQPVLGNAVEHAAPLQVVAAASMVTEPAPWELSPACRTAPHDFLPFRVENP